LLSLCGVEDAGHDVAADDEEDIHAEGAEGAHGREMYPVWKTTTATAAKARRTWMLLSLVVVFIDAGNRDQGLGNANLGFGRLLDSI
jgi:hypothetical protein